MNQTNSHPNNLNSNQQRKQKNNKNLLFLKEVKLMMRSLTQKKKVSVKESSKTLHQDS